jgi:RNA 2',3'-cyclic 3'-phosphodiesterase
MAEPESTDDRWIRAEKLRLFVALDLPAAARGALGAFRDAEVAAAPEVWRPVRDEALHLTLAFLGHRPSDDVEVITPLLEACAGPAPPLALGPALLLPPRRARVLCAEVDDGAGELASLQGRVSAGLADAGVYEPEKRPFRAHATVARLRSGARSPRAAATDGPERLPFAGEALTLYRSSLRRGGAQYEPLVRVPLGEA